MFSSLTLLRVVCMTAKFRKKEFHFKSDFSSILAGILNFVDSSFKERICFYKISTNACFRKVGKSQLVFVKFKPSLNCRLDKDTEIY